MATPDETATYIGQLSAGGTTEPQDADGPYKGAAEIRKAKDIMKATLPNLNGAATITHTELNLLVGLTRNASSINTGSVPSGTKMIFYQASAPTGWTRTTGFANTKMLRLVSDGGGGGTFAGTDDPILMNKVPSHTHAFVTSSDGAHTHTFQLGNNNLDSTTPPAGSNGQLEPGIFTTPSSGAHTHSGTTNANGSASNWQPRYADVIICTKN